MPTMVFNPSHWLNADQALQREWLVANGLGGWASGTLGGANTRRYHGVLVAALRPPVDRRVLVNKLDEWVTVGDRRYALTANEFAGGAIDPRGWEHLERFELRQGLPAWQYRLGDIVIEKKLFAPYGHNATWTIYRHIAGAGPIQLRLTPLLNHRDFHSQTLAAAWSPVFESRAGSLRVVLYPGAHPIWLAFPNASIQLEPVWINHLYYRVEQERGLPATEDALRIGTITATLNPHDAFAILTSAEQPDAQALDWPSALAAAERRQDALEDRCQFSPETPTWVRQLAIAADQFIVGRTDSGLQPAMEWRQPVAGSDRTVIAGYPWFSDWGRDTMIALPGLTLTTGRMAEAAAILRTFGRHLSQGMLPNRFPDSGESPEYNTVDAALWFFHAVDRYFAVTGDESLVRDLLPKLEDIVRWHLRGTRYNIHCDSDGLIFAGEPGVQLTWMDAKVGDWVVTPRLGKPVEINALWINALRAMAAFHRRLGLTSELDYQTLADRANQSFGRFWNAVEGHLYDVMDAPASTPGLWVNDASLRPNQLLAVSLPYAPLDSTDARARAVVDSCLRALYTPVGLRSLAPGLPGYAPHFWGGPRERDGAYHQGAVWGWLIGPFVEAFYKVYGDKAKALELLRGLPAALESFGIGSLAEVYDASEPFKPGGCFAQAWSVSEALRLWRLLAD